MPFTLLLVFLIILTQIDLESIKESLIEKVSSETGLKVEIDEIGFGFSGGLGLQCKGVKVSTPKGNHYSVDRLDLLAAWSPLLSGEFEIKSAALIHPVIKLEIPERPQPPIEKEKPEKDNKEKPEDQPGLVSSKTLQSTTSKIKDTPLTIDKFVISDGQIILTHPGGTKQLLLNVDGTFKLNRAEGMDILAKAVKVQTGSIIFEGDGTVSNLGADNAGIAMNLNTGGFALKEIQPTLQFFGVSLQETPLQAIDVDRLLLKAEFPLNSLSKMEVLKKQMTGHIDVKTRNTILKPGYSIETLEGEATWENGVLSHNFSGTALASEFNLNGKFPFSGLDKDSISRVEWKNLDIGKLPLKEGMAWSPTQGKVSGKLSLTGPLTQEKSQLKGSVEFQAEGLVLKPANEGRPIEMSRLTGRGDFDQGQLQHEIHGNVWGSAFDIKGKVGMDNPVLNSTINWTGLDVAQLPSGEGWQPVEGKLSGTLKLLGPTPAEGEKFPGQLEGSLKFKAQNLKLQNADSALSLKQLEGSGDLKNHQVNYDLKGDTFDGTFHSDGRIILSASGASPPVLNNKIEFSHIDLSQLLTTSEKGNLSGTIKLNGPLPDAENLLTGKLRIDTSFNVTDLSMSAGSVPLNIKHLEGKASLKQGKLTHDLNGSLFGGNMAVKGDLTFHKNKITADSNLMLNHVGLDWAPLIHKSAPSSGTVTGNLKIKGPLPTDEKISPELKLKGSLEGEKLVFENRTIETAKLNFEESTSTLTQVQVELDKIKLEDKNFKKVIALFKITPQKIELTKGKVWPMNGLILLVGDLRPESGSYHLKFKGEELQVEELFPKHLMGSLQFSGAMDGTLPQGKDEPGLPDYSRDLSGDIKFKLVDGAIPELGTLKNFLTLLNPTTALNAQKKGLSYDYLGGDFKIVKGVVHTDNFEMISPQINLNVVGKANLVDDTVLAQVKAMPLQMLDKTIKAIPLLGAILGGGKKGGVIETYFKVHGKLSQPDFTMQAHKSLTEKPGSILKELLNLPKNLGSGK
ncbi:MAG: AsmA-like C-terminal domain-containing protein [Nitrospinae bacterium]|nr:AsmA-like C-terminal domain-containing protein [Nitrospinota bacterium]